MKKRQKVRDPVEEEVRRMLKVACERDNEASKGLDFYLPSVDLYIECKQFFTPRLCQQLSRVPSENVVVIQGLGTMEKLRTALTE